MATSPSALCRRLRPLFVGLALLLGALALSSPVNAQSDSEDHARTYFDAGRVAYADGDFERALDNFQHSYELSHKPMLLYNVGMALDRLRRDEEAIAAYEQYLQAIPTAENRPAVERRLVLLRQSVARARAGKAPSAEETARADLAPLARADGQTSSSQAPSAPDRPSSVPIYRKWWLWTSIGLVVAGGVVAGVLISKSGDSGDPAPRGAVQL
jgi:tetratricopeptide (TPR) repeat protein